MEKDPLNIVINNIKNQFIFYIFLLKTPRIFKHKN